MNRRGTRAIASLSKSAPARAHELLAQKPQSGDLIIARQPTPNCPLVRGDRRAGLAVAVVLAILLAQADPQAQIAGRIAGTVQDAAGNPLTGVVVTLAGIPGLEARTDREGRFVLEPVPNGDHVITATHADVARVLVPFASSMARLPSST